ncbi:MAG: transcriptional regulator [Halobacteriovorax sp.]|nr:transcriptional regulator [Halobacteriovorax sp.]
MSAKLTIGQLSKKCGITVETIRFYESKGLIPTPSRADNGYRYYVHESIDTLKFIQTIKSLGYSLNEIKELLPIHKDKNQVQLKKTLTEKLGMITTLLNNIEQDGKTET